MIKKILVLLFVLFVFIAGCSNNGLDNDQENVSNGSGLNVSENWCDDSSVINISDSSGGIRLEVIGIEDTGEYEGMCHIRYQMDSVQDGDIIDYYLYENGSGFQIMNIDGQQTKTEWSGS